jgi:pilus assembly protein Flp/PilA
MSSISAVQSGIVGKHKVMKCLNTIRNIAVEAGSKQENHMDKLCGLCFHLTFKGIEMNKIVNAIKTSVQSFAKDEEGAQVVEYALIIAVVSIGLVVALGDAATGLRASFATLVTRVTTCFTAGAACT